MTRDEAIAVLQEEIDGNLELTLREWRERDEQRLFPALRMAIEALQALTDDDIISREGILHELAELSDSYEKQYPREKEMIHGLILICRKAIVNYPSADRPTETFGIMCGQSDKAIEYALEQRRAGEEQ